MNSRIHQGKSAIDRLSALVRSVTHDMHYKLNRLPDYADYREALEPFIQRELILARIDELRKAHAEGMTTRIRELMAVLTEIEINLPEDHRL